MPISYLSHTFKANPYVLPLDLDLYSKVMSTKQNEYDAEADKIQGAINQVSSLDILKGNVKEYANGKVSEMVKNLNDVGGQDLSDPNISSKIESSVSGIYNDKIILNGIAGTQQVRSLMKGYDDFKMNPKQKGKYSVANEYNDTRAVDSWLKDGKLDSSYQGNSSPTAYVDYKKTDLENLKNLPTDQYQTITQGNSTYVFDKVNHKYLTPEKVMGVVDGLRTPDERAQIKRDATYFSDVQAKYSPTDLISRRIEQESARLDSDYHNQMQQYSSSLLVAANDPTVKKQIQQNIIDLQNEYKSNSSIYKTPEGLQKLAQSYQFDPDEFKYQVYNSDYKTGLGNRFAVNQETRDIEWNQGQMFVDRQRMEQAKMKQDQNQFDANLGLRQQEMQINMADKGVVSRVNPLTGQQEYIKVGGTKGTGSVRLDINGNPFPDIPLLSSDKTANPEESFGINTDKVQSLIQGSVDNQDKIIGDYFNGLKTLHPELAKVIDNSSANNPDWMKSVQQQSVLDVLQSLKSGGDPNKFEPSDFADLNRNPTIQKFIQQGALKQQTLDTMQKMFQNINDAASNNGGTIKLSPDAQPVYENLMKEEENIRYNKGILNKRDEYISNQMSPDERKQFLSSDGSVNWNKINSNYQQLPKNTPNYGYGMTTTTSPTSDLAKRLKDAETDYYATKVSLSPEYSKKAFDGIDNDEQRKYYGDNVFNTISDYERNRNGNQVLPNQVILRGVGKSTDGTVGYEVSYDVEVPASKRGEKPTYQTKILKVNNLNPNQQQPFLQNVGVGYTNPFEHIDNTLKVNNTTLAYSYPTANSDKPFRVNSRVVNLDQRNPNSATFMLQYGFPTSQSPRPDHPEDYEWHDVKYGNTGSLLADEASKVLQSYKPSKFASTNNLLKDEFTYYLDGSNQMSFEDYKKQSK